MKKQEAKKSTRKQNINRGLSFIALFSGYLLAILDEKNSESIFNLLNNLSQWTFIGIYLFYFLTVISLLFYFKSCQDGYVNMKETYKKREYLLFGIKLFLLGFFSGFVTSIGTELIKITIPYY